MFSTAMKHICMSKQISENNLDQRDNKYETTALYEYGTVRLITSKNGNSRGIIVKHTQILVWNLLQSGFLKTKTKQTSNIQKSIFGK
jgi:hypothetical protein